MGAIRYMPSWSPLVRLEDTLNTVHVTLQGVLRPVAYPLFEPCETIHFRKIMHDRKLTVLYGPSFIRKMFGFSPGRHLSPIQNVRSMVADRLARHLTAVAKVDELWDCFEASWTFLLYIPPNLCLT
ncbi:hypothetical protein TNCV_4195761 [Trichonephila clavipes]|nr:hypothetical protein TNCV_4195761 [Trichonephila clavipes]